MATIYATASGQVVGVALVNGGCTPATPPAAPPTQTLGFDEATNAGALAALRGDLTGHTLVAGQLLHRGQPVALAPPGPGATEQAAVQAAATAFLAGTDLTLAQLNQVMRWLVRQRLAQGG